MRGDVTAGGVLGLLATLARSCAHDRLIFVRVGARARDRRILAEAAVARARALITICVLVLSVTIAHANIETSIAQLGGDGSSRVRLAAALSLSKSNDPRAVNALSRALEEDRDADIRHIAALALEKMIGGRTAPDAIAIGVRALENATRDRDAKVRTVALRAFKKLAPLARRHVPPVFVNIDATHDQSRRLPPGGGERLVRIVKQSVERTGYATTWPGGLPTAAELASHRTRAFIVASTVQKVEITMQGSRAQIACTVAVRIAPWGGRDGGERWEANRAASATGSAKAQTGSRDRDVQKGVRDCVEAVTEDVTDRQVVPFLKRIASTGG
jgi:hypothetical protein